MRHHVSVSDEPPDWRRFGDVAPPFRVRLAFAMRFPVPRQWRRWAYAKIMERYGDHPSMEGTQLTYGTEWGGVRSAHRVSPWTRRQWLLWANNLKTDGTPLKVTPSPWRDVSSMLDRMSDKWLGLLPFLFLGGCVVVVVVTTVVALHFV